MNQGTKEKGNKKIEMVKVVKSNKKIEMVKVVKKLVNREMSNR